MEKIARQLLSMRMMAVAMIVFLVAIGAATLIESQYDIQNSDLILDNNLQTLNMTGDIRMKYSKIDCRNT